LGPRQTRGSGRGARAKSSFAELVTAMV
jgi:hypothetical protein